MKCDICGEPVVLRPTAKERAAKFGGTPGHYIGLFRTHAACAIAKRDREVRELIRRASPPSTTSC